MKIIILNIMLATVLLVLTAGCTDFLDEEQDNRARIDNREKIAQLLTSAYANAQYAEVAESMSDNADDKGPDASADRMINEKAYKWEDFVSERNTESVSNYWEASYTAIAHANHALSAIEELEGTEDFSQLKGEALVARAYAHFMLVNFFSMRYDPKTAVMGIPYVTSPEQNAIFEYKRETMEETYRLIQKDLEEGLELVGNEYEKPKFHFTANAANAFATRFYLYKGEWQKVIDHANVILTGDPAEFIRDQVSTAFRSQTYTQTAIQYSSSKERANLLITWTTSVYGRTFAANRYALSFAKRNEFFFQQQQHPFNKEWGYRIFGSDLTSRIPKYEEYFRVTNPTAGIGFAFLSSVAFTTDEVLLNRAEAYAMSGQFDNAISDLQAFLSQKTLDYDPQTDILTIETMKDKYPDALEEYSPFYPLLEDQATFVKGIAEFRRREFCHEGLRWLDIKRFNIVVEHKLVGESEAIMLERDDPRRAIQIPESATSFGITPNKR